jgi:primosomal protein N' (replication factor Y)
VTQPSVEVAAPDETRVAVAVDLPQHAGLTHLLHYGYDVSPAATIAPGQLLRVPLGRRVVTGIAWPDREMAETDVTVKPVAEVMACVTPLSAAWLQLLEFSATYYQRSLGELALSVLPPELRKLDARQLGQRRDRWLRREAPKAEVAPALSPTDLDPLPELTAEQQRACSALLEDDPRPKLLFGATGSGKTEVYLRQAQRTLALGKQVLVLVPEINLTPQLEARFAQRFPAERLVSLHSGLTPARRLQNWLLAHEGRAGLVLGTRLAVFASMPRLGLIVVDEEHDPSFKQQDGARYSARDLAVYRGQLEHALVLLGSATPSLESWQRALEGRYRRIDMPSRIGDGAMPAVRLLDMSQLPRDQGPNAPALAPPLLRAIEERIARGEQSLLLLNRRGYAPVLHCSACSWKSQCAHCSAWRVFHKADRTLRCHHCGYTERVPRACPDCGNLDISPIGRGTEKLEEQIAALLPQARVARIDADSTRLKGSLDAQLSAVHAGDVDILVGTQMVTKGHDFRRITLVAAVNPDGALFASDFRAAERLFSLLLQAAGRAGRDAQAAARSEMWLQTWHPQHAVYAALKRHDYPAFAEQQLAERRSAGLPPFAHLALLRVDAKVAADAAAFLRAATSAAADVADAERVVIYPPVPPPIARVADVERMQMLVESTVRPALQRFLQAWQPALLALRNEHRGVLRWAVDVDPLGI